MESTAQATQKSSYVQEAGWSLVGCFAPEAGRQQMMIHRSPFMIGRDPKNDVCVNSRKVSKSHAILQVVDDSIFIKDIASTNGTYVNGFRITRPTPVGPGDLIQFADMEFQIVQQAWGTPDETYSADDVTGDWLISKMHQILNLGQFYMVYQPIIGAQGQRWGVEALLRCDIQGLESPVKLFNAAVQLGLEDHLSDLARKKATETVAHLGPQNRLFLNTHPNEHLGEELLESISNLRAAAAQWKIVVEVHEAAVPDLQTIQIFRDALHDMNVELAYDDFGAGQSRLREISEVPPDYVKFDRGLIDGLSKANSRQHAMIRSLVNLCHDSQISTIAEGIETADDAACCQELGFDLFQGYHFARPDKVENVFSDPA